MPKNHENWIKFNILQNTTQLFMISVHSSWFPPPIWGETSISAPRMGPYFLKHEGELRGEKPSHIGGRFTQIPPTILPIWGPRFPPSMRGSKIFRPPPHHDMGEVMFMFIDGGKQTEKSPSPWGEANMMRGR